MENITSKIQKIAKTPDFAVAGELMKTIFESIDSNHTKYIRPDTIRKLYRQFRLWRDLVSEKQRKSKLKRDLTNFQKAFECGVLKYLLERCYWMQYGDSELVAYLLIASYETVGDLGKLIDYRDERYWSYGEGERSEENYFRIKSTFVNRSIARKKVSPVDYFMHHANKRKVLFGGKRFHEQCFFSYRLATLDGPPRSLSLPPCSLSFQYTDLLQKLLKYGLFIYSKPNDPDVGKLLTGIIGIYLNRPKEFIDHSGHFAPNYIAKANYMGEHLLRAVESVNPSILMKSQDNRLAKIKILLEVNEKFLPNLVLRFYRVQDLRHLCRCKVRRILYESWQLPIGIEVLPLPEILKDYLNLKQD